MKILVADKLQESCLEQLRALASEVVYRPDLKAEGLADQVDDIGIVIVRSTKVLPNVIERARNLQLIVRAGAGVNTIAVPEASAHGIYVANCPGKNSAAVAELAMGLILALDRRIVDNTEQLRAGQWNKSEFSKARGLAGRTLGIIGMGQIGQLVAARARAFEMNVIGWSRSLTSQKAEELECGFCHRPRDVAAQSDIVTLHVAASPDTEKMVNAEFLASMKRGAYLINTSRGEIVEEPALMAAVRERDLRVGLDVFAAEPAGGTGTFKSSLFEHPNIIGTHHIGASTDQAQDAIAQEVVRIVRGFLVSGEVPNCVNIAATSPATWQLIVRHYDRVGVIASVLEAIKADHINAEEVSNRIFQGAKAACCSIMLDDRPSDEAMKKISAHQDVIQAELRAVV